MDIARNYISCKLTILFLLLIFEIKAEVFSSTALLKLLVEYEHELKSTAENFLKLDKQRWEDNKLLLQDIESPSYLPTSVTYAGHPINAYHLVQSWNKLLTAIPQVLEFPDFVSLLQHKGIILPNENDVFGATIAIIRLQRLYYLQTPVVAKGEILGYVSYKPLSGYDMVNIGRTAMELNDFGLAAQWFYEATQINDGTTSKAVVLLELAKANQAIGDLEGALKAVTAADSEDPSNIEVTSVAQRLTLQLELAMMRDGHKQGVNMTTWVMPSSTDKRYESLCRGDEIERPQRILKTLTCRYKQGHLPYTVYKEEVLSWDPRISMFYEVISETLSDRIKDRALSLLERGIVGDPLKKSTVGTRVSKVAWLWDVEYAWVKNLSNQIMDVSGLDTEIRDRLSSAEPFQVVNYGIGGQYEPHHDFFMGSVPEENFPLHIRYAGDRIATFLYYLSEVGHGGSTVFPEVGVRVPPVKNAAAFWYNMKPSGDFDMRTLHAGCPVLLGEKWVANKWIREKGQIFRKPCGIRSSSLWDVY